MLTDVLHACWWAVLDWDTCTPQSSRTPPEQQQQQSTNTSHKSAVSSTAAISYCINQPQLTGRHWMRIESFCGRLAVLHTASNHSAAAI